MTLDGAVTAITGGSRGLGRALALAVAARGGRLALIGRDEPSLAATAAEIARRGSDARVYAADLRRYRECGPLLHSIASDLGSIDVLVCNAAAGTAGMVVDLPMTAYEDNLEVNFLAPVALTQEWLRLGVNGRRRALCFILSGVALRSPAVLSAYAAGKAALGAFADALRIELQGSPVNVLTVIPGTMDTEFVSRMPRVGNAAAIVTARRRASPDRVARRIVAALERDRRRVFLWGPARVVYHLDHFVPGLVDRLLTRMQRRALIAAKRVS